MSDSEGVAMTGGSSHGYWPTNVLAEYRLSRRYGRPAIVRIICLGVVALITGIAIVFGQDTLPTETVLLVVCAVLILYNAVVTLWRARFRTRVRSDGIEIHGYFNHFVPWSDVQGVLTDGYGGARAINDAIEGRMPTSSGRRYYTRRSAPSSMGRRARTATVRLVRADGHPMLLRAPLVTAWAPDPEFDNKIRQLQGFCKQYAGGRRTGAAGLA